MKRIIITIGALMAMSFTPTLMNNNDNLSEVKDDLYDYLEWMEQDIECGNINPEIGELYIENFENTIKRLNNIERNLIHLTEN